jgi:hypothetical protein
LDEVSLGDDCKPLWRGILALFPLDFTPYPLDVTNVDDDIMHNDYLMFAWANLPLMMMSWHGLMMGHGLWMRGNDS